MATVIFKWNPGFSSYTMMHYLIDLSNLSENDTFDYNWSVWDWDKIHKGDRFYWIKLGYGAKGIVGTGLITSDPYSGDDWSGQGRKTYYVDYKPETLINPDTLPILDMRTLEAEMPEFEWAKGHSGLVLAPDTAAKLDSIWKNFVDKNMELFEEREHNQNSENDRFYTFRSPIE
jgi:hypothetical protein